MEIFDTDTKEFTTEIDLEMDPKERRVPFSDLKAGNQKRIYEIT